MIDWFCHQHLLEDVISTRLEIDISPIPRLLFAQRPLKKELDSLTKNFTGVAVLRARHWPCHINRLRKVLVERLLPSSPVLSLEHIFEFRKGVNPSEFTLFCPFIEFGDCLINCEFDWVSAVILMDFNAAFVLGIVALQICRLPTRCHCRPISFCPYRRGDACRWRPSRLFGCFVHPSVFLTKLRTFFVTPHVLFVLLHVLFVSLHVLFVLLHVLFVLLHVWFAWIYHVPRDIAVITVRYRTEVDKLKLK